jgi:hypothetical protein
MVYRCIRCCQPGSPRCTSSIGRVTHSVRNSCAAAPSGAPAPVSSSACLAAGTNTMAALIQLSWVAMNRSERSAHLFSALLALLATGRTTTVSDHHPPSLGVLVARYLKPMSPGKQLSARFLIRHDTVMASVVQDLEMRAFDRAAQATSTTQGKVGASSLSMLARLTRVARSIRERAHGRPMAAAGAAG